MRKTSKKIIFFFRRSLSLGRGAGFIQPHFLAFRLFVSQGIQQRRQGRSGAGFTLIELLIVTAIFSLTALIATTVFTRIQSNQRGILSRQRVVADGRYILETMARTAKLGMPDFDFYTKISGAGFTNRCGNSITGTTHEPCNLKQPQSMLVIRDQTNAQTCYRLNASAKQLEISSDCTGAAPSWLPITSSDLIVNDFQVYVHPWDNPFRPAPSSAGDCATPTAPTTGPVVHGFDQSSGACRCTADTQSSDCYAGQRQTNGQNCIIFSASNPSTIGNQCGLASVNPDGTCICQNANTQPSVTIYLDTNSINSALNFPSQLQTTVTSRIYRR